MSSTNPTLINGFEDVMTHIRKLEEENKKLKEENKKLKCEDDKLEDTLASLNFYTEQCAELKEEIFLTKMQLAAANENADVAVHNEAAGIILAENDELKEKLERVTKVRDDFVHTCASLNTALEIIGQEVQQDILKEEIDERVDDRGELDNDKLLQILYQFFNVDEDED